MGEGEEKLALLGTPGPVDHESGCAEFGGHPFGRELRTDLGEDLFSRSELDPQVSSREIHRGGLGGREPHLDAFLILVPPSDVGELLDVEVTAELSVEDVEHVFVEGSRDPGRVVVGRNEYACL